MRWILQNKSKKNNSKKVYLKLYSRSKTRVNTINYKISFANAAVPNLISCTDTNFVKKTLSHLQVLRPSTTLLKAHKWPTMS